MHSFMLSMSIKRAPRNIFASISLSLFLVQRLPFISTDVLVQAKKMKVAASPFQKFIGFYVFPRNVFVLNIELVKQGYIHI
jgi:hypothetical protein